MTLYLVRHAQSEANAGGVFTGGWDVPLTALGRAQSEALAARLQDEPIAAVYASTLSRAQDTAQAVAARLGLAVEVREGLREAGLGEAEGLPWTTVRERWPIGAGATWADAIPGAEGGVAVRHRVAAEVDELLLRHRGETVLAVSHAGAITHALQHVLGMPLEAGPRFRILHAALNVVDEVDGDPFVLALNDGCHLESVESIEG
ncbi:MAG: histidine phosphatase family protein [Dehalococcoidia bacterium]